jgi:organic hydroperoxide reductase OsmC/OhrA
VHEKRYSIILRPTGTTGRRTWRKIVTDRNDRSDRKVIHPYPHTYEASASGQPTGAVAVASPGLETLSTAPPAEFGGPGDRWSPETLLVASVANCFVLTLRTLARAAKFPWLSIDCDVEGVLERVEGVTRFSRFVTRARLIVPSGADEAIARRLLERSEHGCLIANSLRAERHLEAEIVAREAALVET